MSSSRLNGIDVSKYQPDIDWPEVKRAGYTFAYARATYGDSQIDAYFNSHWQGMKAAGIVRGAYHFFVAADDATLQAELFLKAVGSLAGGDLPPVIDVEADSGTGGNLAGGVQTWLDMVERKLGRVPVIYTAPAYWNEYLTGGFGRYPLWVAEYGVSWPKPVKGWDAWTFWQHSESGAVPGVAGNVDLDYFNGSLAALEALANAPAGSLTAAPPAETAPTASTRPAASTSTTNTPAAPPRTTPATATPTRAGAQTYTVRPGDTLSAIAESYGTTVEAIAQANRIANPNEIEVGQVLSVTHAPSATPAAHASTSAQTYTVKAGDTLSTIAARHGTTAEAIAQANDIRDENLIDVGQVLTIP